MAVDEIYQAAPQWENEVVKSLPDSLSPDTRNALNQLSSETKGALVTFARIARAASPDPAFAQSLTQDQLAAVLAYQGQNFKSLVDPVFSAGIRHVIDYLDKEDPPLRSRLARGDYYSIVGTLGITRPAAKRDEATLERIQDAWGRLQVRGPEEIVDETALAKAFYKNAGQSRFDRDGFWALPFSMKQELTQRSRYGTNLSPREKDVFFDVVLTAALTATYGDRAQDFISKWPRYPGDFPVTNALREQARRINIAFAREKALGMQFRPGSPPVGLAKATFQKALLAISESIADNYGEALKTGDAKKGPVEVYKGWWSMYLGTPSKELATALQNAAYIQVNDLEPAPSEAIKHAGGQGNRGLALDRFRALAASEPAQRIGDPEPGIKNQSGA